MTPNRPAKREQTPFAHIDIMHPVNRAKRYTVKAYYGAILPNVLILVISQPDEMDVTHRTKTGDLDAYRRLVNMLMGHLYENLRECKLSCHTLKSLFSGHYVGGNYYRLNHEDLGSLRVDFLKAIK